MGNLQHLAQKVLSRYCSNTRVSCSPPLVEETGNFRDKSGNNPGNCECMPYKKGLPIPSFKEETIKETARIPVQDNQETFGTKIHDKSFLSDREATNVLDGFFSDAAGLNMKLLPDDKRWLKVICVGINRAELGRFLSQYIECWHNAMQRESVIHKKQNVGRRAANIWFREALIKQHTL